MIFLKGNSRFDFEIVGEKHRQSALEQFAGPKTEYGVEHFCIAGLTLEVDNPHDANAVAVHIIDTTTNNGQLVGYFSRDDAKALRVRIAELNIDPKEILFANARIVGGWRRWEEVFSDDPDDDDDLYDTSEPDLELIEGLFGVKLDLLWPVALDPTFADITAQRK